MCEQNRQAVFFSNCSFPEYLFVFSLANNGKKLEYNAFSRLWLDITRFPFSRVSE